MVNEDAALLNRHVTSMTPSHFSTGVYSTTAATADEESELFRTVIALIAVTVVRTFEKWCYG